jgi:hypothetical protein
LAGNFRFLAAGKGVVDAAQFDGEVLGQVAHHHHAQSRFAPDQIGKSLAFHHQQNAGLGRHGVGGPRRSVQKGQFPENLAVAQLRDGRGAFSSNWMLIFAAQHDVSLVADSPLAKTCSPGR